MPKPPRGPKPPPGPREPEYVSMSGHARLVDELTRLRSVDRPRIVEEVAAAAAQGDRSENAEYIYGKKKLREIDRRMGFLERRLSALVPLHVDAPRGTEKAYFGAWVTLEGEDGEEESYRILGVDEVDAGRGIISYKSPLGRSLLGKAEGDTVTVMSPRGRRELTLLAVAYGPARDR